MNTYQSDNRVSTRPTGMNNNSSYQQQRYQQDGNNTRSNRPMNEGGSGGNNYNQNRYSQPYSTQQHFASDTMNLKKGGLLPNEIRVSAKNSTINSIVKQITYVLRNGFQNVKLVGRGQACQLTQDIVAHLRENTNMPSSYSFDVKNTSAFNIIGEVVDELHVMIRERTSAHANSGKAPESQTLNHQGRPTNMNSQSSANTYRQPRQFQTITSQTLNGPVTEKNGGGVQGAGGRYLTSYGNTKIIRDDVPYSMRQQQQVQQSYPQQQKRRSPSQEFDQRRGDRDGGPNSSRMIQQQPQRRPFRDDYEIPRSTRPLQTVGYASGTTQEPRLQNNRGYQQRTEGGQNTYRNFQRSDVANDGGAGGQRSTGGNYTERRELQRYSNNNGYSQQNTDRVQTTGNGGGYARNMGSGAQQMRNSQYVRKENNYQPSSGNTGYGSGRLRTEGGYGGNRRMTGNSQGRRPQGGYQRDSNRGGDLIRGNNSAVNNGINEQILVVDREAAGRDSPIIE
eukprot:403362873